MRDLIIIGSGPAGYTAAIYAARAQLNPLLIASSVAAGGELMKTTDVENFPGFPGGVMGPDLMVNMQEQAERFGTEILYDDVVEVDLTGTTKVVKTGAGEVYEAKAVIISTGAAYRTLGLSREEKLSGHGVSWCATCDGFFFREKVVAVVGGGDSAMEEADFLTKHASKVYLIHRKNTFKASKAMQDRVLNNPKVEVIYGSTVIDLVGESKLERIRVLDLDTLESIDLDIDGLFIAIGSDPRSELFAGQVDLAEDKFILVDGRSSRTNIRGVFAAGDVIDPTYRQAITAAGSGCVAALDAENYISSLKE